MVMLALLVWAVPAAQAGSQGKTALLVVAKSDFSSIEYSKPRSALESAGVTCTVASTATGTCRSDGPKRAKAELVLSSVNAADYDAIVIIGGNGIKIKAAPAPQPIKQQP